jgi:hypothetical protein
MGLGMRLVTSSSPSKPVRPLMDKIHPYIGIKYKYVKRAVN